MAEEKGYWTHDDMFDYLIISKKSFLWSNEFNTVDW